MSKWKVYLSSTYKDLKDQRAEIIGLFSKQLKEKFELCEIMEHMYDDGNQTPFVETCVDAVKSCHIYVIIQGKSIGSFIPDSPKNRLEYGKNKTYTEVELDTALSNKKYIFFIRQVDPDHTEIEFRQKYDEIVGKFLGKYSHDFTNSTELIKIIYACLFPFASKSPLNRKNPYKGLTSFNVEDGEYFYGREKEIDDCEKQILTSSGSFFLSIIGDSGIGKSSFVKAGLLYRLKTGQSPFSEYKQIIFSPGNRPFTNLRYQLISKQIISNDDITIESIVSKLVRTIVFVDQFEEVITQCHSNDSILERTKLFELLDSLVQPEFSGNSTVIISNFRIDFASTLANFHFIGGAHQSKYLLNSLDYKINPNYWEKSFRDIIIKPAEKNGVAIEETLVHKLKNELTNVDGSLPILQFTLKKLWVEENIKDRLITTSEFVKTSNNRGLSGIIENHANSVYKRITNNGRNKENEAILKSIFVNLVEVTSSKNDVKKTIDKNQLFSKLKCYNHNSSKIVYEDLISEKSRLLVTNSSVIEVDSKNRDLSNTGIKELVKVDIVHESLIRQWDKLRSWVDQRRDALVYQTRLQNHVDGYYKNEEKLFGWKKIRTTSKWLSNNPDLGTEKIEKFLTKSKNRIAGYLKHLCITLFVIFIAGMTYNQHIYPTIHRKNFFKNMANYPRLVGELEKVEYLVDSVKTVYIDDSNFDFMLTNLQYFEGLERIEISNVKNKDISHSTWIRELKNPEKIKFLKIARTRNLFDLNGIENLGQLEELVVSGLFVDRLDITALSDLQSLKSLEFDFVILQDLNPLLELKNLEKLVLNCDFITERVDLSPVDELLALKSLTFGEFFQARKVLEFPELEQVQELNLEKINGFEQILKNSTKLGYLKITGEFNSEEIINMDFVETLNGLVLRNTFSFDFSSLISFKQLSSLQLIGCELTDLQYLPELDNLNTLTLRENVNLRSLEGIDKFKNLTELVIERNPNLISLDRKQATIRLGEDKKTLPNVKKLILSRNDRLNNISGISHFVGLEFLQLDFNDRLDSLEGLENLKNLNVLNVQNNKSLKSIFGVEKLIKLNTLKIGQEVSNDTVFPNLNRLKSLDSLDIFSADNFTNLEIVQELDGLHFLSISHNNKLTDLRGIENLKSLNTLALYSNPILKNLNGIEMLSNLDKIYLGQLENFEPNSLYKPLQIKQITIEALSMDEIINSDSIIKHNPEIKITKMIAF